jgi:hypothetical protein
MGLLSRDAILQVDDLVYEDVSVPEWGGMVRVKALAGAERDAFEAYIAGEQQGKKRVRNLRNIRARMAAMAMVDEKGKAIFRPSDIETLGKKSAAALDRVFDAAMRLAGMRDEDIDELTENFPEGPKDDSTSD